MAWGIFKWFGKRVASEVHKSKIEDFEKRIADMEKNQKLIMKSLENNESKIEKLDDRVYKANMESATAVGAIKTLVQSGIQNNSLPKANDHE